MVNAQIDGNFIATIIAVSILDLLEPVNVAVNPLNNAVIVEMG